MSQTKENSAYPDSGVVSFINTEELKRDVAINPHDLDNMMTTHPSLLLHYSIQMVKAKSQYDAIKSRMEILEAKLDSHYRTGLAEDGKKPTEAAIKNAIVADEKYAILQKRVLAAYEVWRCCAIAEEAFSHRKDMILEMARDRRKEREEQLKTLESQELRQNVLSRLSEKKTI